MAGDVNHTDGGNPNFYKRFIELSRELLRVERETAIQMRNQGRIGDELLRKIERELDLVEVRLAEGKQW